MSQSIFRAFDYAIAIGTPLNIYVVIVLIDRATKSAAAVFADIRQRYRNWLSYRLKKAGREGEAPAYIYAIENPNGNHHANWAVHIPPGLEQEFLAKLPRWIERAQGECRPYDLKACPIKQSHAKRLAKYIVKGTDPAFVDHFFLTDLAAPQGEVWGKRAGVSPSLGHSARKAAAFHPGRGRHYRWAA